MSQINLKDYVMDTMRQYSDREMTQRDLIDWFPISQHQPFTFNTFNVRDTLYSLEAKGKIERTKLPTDRHWYWRLKLS